MLELLAPAGSFEALQAAVQNGANAVYLGVQSFNARASAANFSFEELKKAVAYVDEEWVQYFDKDSNVYCGFKNGEIACFCLVDFDVECILSDENSKVTNLLFDYSLFTNSFVCGIIYSLSNIKTRKAVNEMKSKEAAKQHKLDVEKQQAADTAKALEGKKVKITDGPFKNMVGKVSSYDLENKKVELLLDLFGQETSVEVSLSEIENLK